VHYSLQNISYADYAHALELLKAEKGLALYGFSAAGWRKTRHDSAPLVPAF
jgi:hypothetical protein